MTASTDSPTSRSEKVSLAIRLGAEFNAFSYYWVLACLTRVSATLAEAYAHLEEIAKLLGESQNYHAPRSELLRLSLELDTIFTKHSSGVCWISEASTHTMPGSWTTTRIAEDSMRRIHVLPGYVRKLLLAAFNDLERRAFELGQVIDQGVRPPGIHQHVHHRYCAGYSEATVNQLIQAGAVPPEESWSRKLGDGWAAVFGSKPAFERLMRESEPCLDPSSLRRALVARLRERVSQPEHAEFATFVPPEPVPQTESPASTFIPLEETDWIPLEFIQHGKNLTVIDKVTGKRVNFTGEQKAYEVLELLKNRPDPSVRGKSLRLSKYDVFDSLWPTPAPLTDDEKARGKKPRPRPDREGGIVSTYVSIGNRLLEEQEFGWEIDTARFGGYLLQEHVESGPE